MRGQIQEGNPETEFTFKTTLEEGENTLQLHEFILRCRIRVGYDDEADRVPGTPAEIMEDMELNYVQNEDSYIRIKSQEAKAIADNTQEPIRITGVVTGKAKAPQYCIFSSFCIGGPVTINPIDSNIVDIGFEYPSVTFLKNTIQFGDAAEQVIAEDIVSSLEINNTLIIGEETMPEAPTFEKEGIVYEFTGWNTEADRSGSYFDQNTPVDEVITLYAQWSTAKDPVIELPIVIFNKNTAQFGDNEHQIHHSVILEEHETNVGDKMPQNPAFPNYEFLGWNTMPDGRGTAFVQDTQVSDNITVYAQWREVKITPSKPDAITITGTTYPKDETAIVENHYKFMFGYPDNIFKPEGNMTRAEAAAMFNRILFEGEDENYVYNGNFTDIKSDDWYAKVVGYMTKNGYISGYPDGSFKPNHPITRAEFASIASKVSKKEPTMNMVFTDIDASHWAYNDISTAVAKGWLKGYENNTFRPDAEITRAEATTVAVRLLDRWADMEFIKANKADVENFSDLNENHWAYFDIMEAANGHEFKRLTKVEKWIRILDIGQIMNSK